MRLIDADAFKEYMWKALEETRGCYPDKGEWAEAITKQFCKDIDDQPTAQPEIIRCGECKYMMEDGRCYEFADDNIRPSASDFCSYAERRTDD